MLTPLARAAAVFEGVLIAAGLGVLARLYVRQRRRSEAAPPAPAFPPWPGTGADLLLFLFAIVAGALVVSLVAGFALRFVHVGVPTANFMLSVAPVGPGFLAGIAGFHFAMHRLQPSRPGRDGRALVRGGATLLAAFPFVAATTLAWGALLEAAGVHVAEQTVAQLFQELPTLSTKVGFGLFACVVAPFNEELIFRAGIFRWLRGRVPRWWAIVLSALIFGGAHWALDPRNGADSFLPLVAFGIALAYAYERTGRISTTMIAHALFNLNTLLGICAGLNT